MRKVYFDLYYVRYGTDCFVVTKESLDNTLQCIVDLNIVKICDIGGGHYCCPFENEKNFMWQKLYNIKSMEVEVD